MNKYLIKPGTKVNLSKLDPDDKGDFEGGKKEGKEELKNLNLRLQELQELLYAEHKHTLLIVLQGIDTAGKDGTINHVFEGVNPQGVHVVSFKVPSQEELDHDYLWRIHKQTPRKGEIGIFNRSHYEDVLVVRIHSLAPEEVWKKRFDHINAFENMLVEEGVAILKFFLYIDKDEQKERFQARLDDPTKHWKFNPGDLQERERWPEYIQAYEDVLSKTSTKCAPWYVIPSNRKWYRNLVVAETIIKTLEGFDMKYPEADWKPEEIVIV
ncbi:MAG: polyphosphate kinase 2 family protein [Chloroflexi bacterium]|nr:MAG: polyphosphate kinase 2 family protein [Chloroflexota bacterium]